MIEAVRVVPYTLSTHVRGETVVRPCWWINVVTDDGMIGRGDAATWQGFGSEPDAVESGIHAMASALLQQRSDQLGSLPGTWPAEARHAGELALLEIAAQRSGRSPADVLAAQLGLPAPQSHVEAHTLVNSPDEARAAVLHGNAAALKIKVTRDVERSIALVRAIAAACPNTPMRLDANGRLTHAGARRLCEQVHELPIDWLEQPFDRLDSFRELSGLGVRLAADESVLREPLAAVFEAADVVVIKPMFVGGPVAALKLALQAENAGRQVCFTHALESPVGRRGAQSVALAWGRGVHGVALERAATLDGDHMDEIRVQAGGIAA